MKFVLVHGSFHYGALWNPVRKHLEAAGHEVHTPTIGGFEPGCNTDDFQDIQLAIAPVLAYILDNDLRDFTLLGHSFGGMIITEIALRLKGTGRINRIVYQNAFVPTDGESIFDMMPDHVGERSAAIAESVNNTWTIPYEAFKAVFINTADDELAQEVYALMVPQPCGQWEGGVSAKGLDTVDLEKTYINAVDDLAQIGNGKNWVELFAHKLGPYRLIEMEGDHEVMFTNPKLLAEKIIEAGNGGGVLST